MINEINETVANNQVVPTDFDLDAESQKLTSYYNLSFKDQQRFNEKFKLQPTQITKQVKSFFAKQKKIENIADAKDKLTKKLNFAFQHPELLEEYHSAITKNEKTPANRSFYDGGHGTNVALTAKFILKLYQENKHLFSEEMQKEIEQFDDPQKIKDLEALALLHDVARINEEIDQIDQDEYKNAFYVALALRKRGDERFTGDKISQEGLDIINY